MIYFASCLPPDHLSGLLGHCCGWGGNVVQANLVALAVQRHFHLYDHR